jgi:hypothetical protein
MQSSHVRVTLCRSFVFVDTDLRWLDAADIRCFADEEAGSWVTQALCVTKLDNDAMAVCVDTESTLRDVYEFQIGRPYPQVKLARENGATLSWDAKWSLPD